MFKLTYFLQIGNNKITLLPYGPFWVSSKIPSLSPPAVVGTNDATPAGPYGNIIILKFDDVPELFYMQVVILKEIRRRRSQKHRNQILDREDNLETAGPF